MAKIVGRDKRYLFAAARMATSRREQEATITELKSGMESLAATVKEQASQIQKVTAQLELQKAASRAVANYQ
jgi:hypothetical protein